MTQPSSTIATSGLIAGNGLNNTFVNTFFANMYATNIISKAQTAISDASAAGEDISDLGNDIFPVVVGNVPSTYASIGSVSSLRTSYYNYARALFASGDVLGFITYYQQATGYALSCLTLSSDIAYKQLTNLEDWGASVNVQSDILTGGLSGWLTVNSTENLTKLGNDFVGLGSVFDYKDLDLMGTARGLTKLILDAQLNMAETLTEFIDDLGLPDEIDYHNEDYEPLLLELLQNIPMDKEFQDAFSFVSNARVINVADVLIPIKSLKTAYDVTSLKSYTTVADALQKFSGLKIKTNNDLGNTLKSLTSAGSLSNLDTITTTLPSDQLTTMLTTLGTGDGVHGQPTLRDIIGPVSGYLLEERLERIVTALAIISASSDGLNIIQGYENISAVATDGGGAPYVVSGVGAGSYASKALAIAAIETALDTYYSNLRSFLSIGDLVLRQACETAYTDWNAIASQVSNSKSLCTKAGIDTSVIANDISNAIALGSSLESYGADVNNLGTRIILSSLVTSDTTGEAITASLTAGQNYKVLQTKGLIPKAFLA